MSRYGVVSGQLGSSVAAQMALLEDATGEPVPLIVSGRANGQGNFRIWGVPARRYRLFVWNVSEAAESQAPTLIGSALDEPMVLDLSQGQSYEQLFLHTRSGGFEVSGRVDLSSVPMSAFALAVFIAMDPATPTPVWARVLSRDGSFVIPNVLPGDYQLRVYASTEARGLVAYGVTRVRVFASAVRDARVLLGRLRTVRVHARVMSGASQECQRARVMLSVVPVHPLLPGQSRQLTVSADTGVMRVDLAPGEYAIMGKISESACQAATVVVGPEESDVTVPLQRLGEVTIRYPASYASGLVVAIKDLTPGRIAPTRAYYSVGPNTEAVFDRLPGGMYEAMAIDSSNGRPVLTTKQFKLDLGEREAIVLEER
ncbi:MAG TPA: hypothetical protein VL173_05755 [Vicinamibacterales bacterium]|jgi:hypothetical protein|nr:hypothetical protein [Vicinamibacterales bacterium]